MALTVTTTTSSQNEIIQSLDMQKKNKKTVIVSVPHINDNIFFTVSASLGPLCDRLAS